MAPESPKKTVRILVKTARGLEFRDVPAAALSDYAKTTESGHEIYIPKADILDIDASLLDDMGEMQKRYAKEPEKPAKKPKPTDIFDDTKLTKGKIDPETIRARHAERLPPTTIYEIDELAKLPSVRKDLRHEELQKEEDFIVIEDQSFPVVKDSYGNQLLDETGKPIRGKVSITTSPKKREMLYAPVKGPSGEHQKDAAGRKIYRRTKGMVMEAPKEAAPAAEAEPGKPITKEDQQLVIEATVTDQSGNTFHEYGFSHTIGGGTRLDSSYEARRAEAISSLIKRLRAQGMPYENMRQRIEQALEKGDAKLYPREIIY